MSSIACPLDGHIERLATYHRPARSTINLHESGRPGLDSEIKAVALDGNLQRLNAENPHHGIVPALCPGTVRLVRGDSLLLKIVTLPRQNVAFSPKEIDID
ncbi:hypothetical protein [Rhizobium leguminosarum]|uniref:hypothetical protein n=1 Tax=Rhizobium leguminosarum TaxID=384 RepID=UPI00124A2766|nr:hypothetical protein [Rhizobium leguminosarum]